MYLYGKLFYYFTLTRYQNLPFTLTHTHTHTHTQRSETPLGHSFFLDHHRRLLAGDRPLFLALVPLRRVLPLAAFPCVHPSLFLWYSVPATLSSSQSVVLCSRCLDVLAALPYCRIAVLRSRRFTVLLPANQLHCSGLQGFNTTLFQHD
ncbi:hypothetical protein Ahy_B02g060231 isoform B [Arachis hypogaea]|uniref:Uncharacterized protein n=1 Tax=Arachis hypogaea TaxID=3818 RepID=A0A445AI38_ARAHY|nr:hypothetical protein Ahy_B02g060231 isoform B [Arachis hypogaea]